MLKSKVFWSALLSVMAILGIIFALWYKGWSIWYFWLYQAKGRGPEQESGFVERPALRVDKNVRTYSQIPEVTLNDFFINDLTLLAVRPRNVLGNKPPLDLLLTFEAQDQNGKSQHYAFWTTYAGCNSGPVRIGPLPSLRRFNSYDLEFQVFTVIGERDGLVKILGSSPACAVYAKGKVAQTEELIKYLQGGEAHFAGKIRDLRKETIVVSFIDREEEMKKIRL